MITTKIHLSPVFRKWLVCDRAVPCYMMWLLVTVWYYAEKTNTYYVMSHKTRHKLVCWLLRHRKTGSTFEKWKNVASDPRSGPCAARRPFDLSHPPAFPFLHFLSLFLYTLTKDDQPLAAAARYQYALNTTLSIFLSFCWHFFYIFPVHPAQRRRVYLLSSHRT